MSRQKKQRLKPLLAKVPPGFLVDAPWLKAQGIDPKSIHDYVERGWLERVVRGVYRRPLPEGVPIQTDIPWWSVLLSLQWIMKYDIHLGGLAALDLAGYAHYLYLGRTPPVYLYGDAPSWLKRLTTDAEILVRRRALFDSDHTGITDTGADGRAASQSFNGWGWALRASSPERAFLEALDELPNNASFDNLDKIFEGLTTLRPKQLITLLTACRSVKVRRLFFVFADRHRHGWRKHLDTKMIDFGSGPRAFVEGGKLHPTYRIYVPQDFVPKTDTESTASA